jgi:P-type conjugative transfer protein TrbL
VTPSPRMPRPAAGRSTAPGAVQPSSPPARLEPPAPAATGTPRAPGSVNAAAAPATAATSTPTAAGQPPPARTLAARAARVALTFAPGRRRFTLVLFAAGVLLLALPAAARAQLPPDLGILDGSVKGYQDISGSWLARIQPLAQRTFALLATLELAVSGLFWALGRESLDAIAASLLRKFIVLAFLFSLLTLFPFWIPTITDSFQAAGQAVSETSVVNPSAVLDLGAAIASKMMLSFGALGFLVNPVGVLIGSFTSFFVLISFALIAAQLCLTLIETYIVLSGGALFLGFAGFRPTAFLAEGYLLYAFQVGAKIYLLYLLMAAGMGIARQWQTLDFSPGFGAGPPTLIVHFQVMCGALIFCLLSWYIPRTLSSRLIHGVSLRLGEALR